MRNQLKIIYLLCLIFSFSAHSMSGKVVVSYGHFSIDAKTAETSTTVSNPSAFHLAYLQPKWNNWEFKIGYSILMADFAGSDMGYGVDAGVNYYPFSDAGDEKFSDGKVTIIRYEMWRPFVGLSFNQRNFQSIRNSYAGFGFSSGIERYFSEKMNLRSELRYVNLVGSSESEAAETSLWVGVVFKLP